MRSGLGIGLTLAKRLMELHGGSVTAHSDGLSRGSTFTLRLPLAQSAADPQSIVTHSLQAGDHDTAA
jgi:signal transduction histidine kinase